MASLATLLLTAYIGSRGIQGQSNLNTILKPKVCVFWITSALLQLEADLMESLSQTPGTWEAPCLPVCSLLSCSFTLDQICPRAGAGAVTLPAPRSHWVDSDSTEPSALWSSCPAPGKASARAPGIQLPLWARGPWRPQRGLELISSRPHY